MTGPGLERGRRPARPKTRNVARRAVDPARLAAWRVLRAVAEEDAYANLVLPKLLREAGLRGRDAGFATELAYGTLRGRGLYDAVLTVCVDRPLDRLDPALLDALRLGGHQWLGMRVPAHAAVDATVDLVRAEVGQGAAGLANAVMRRVTERAPESWPADVAPDRTSDPDGYLAVTGSHPVWIVRALRDGLVAAGRPASELPDLLAADNTAPTVSVAALPGLLSTDDLTDAGAEAGLVSPVGFRLSGPPGALPAIREARARVQDEGSQLVALGLLAAPLADGEDGGRWLDLCAGPGGKAALIGAVLADRIAAGAIPGDGGLVAVETAPHRADLVRSSVAGVERARPGTVTVRIEDGREVGADEPGRYDRVLVDAPCTGLGALRRRPEARWRRTPSDLASLGPVQRALLASALDAVRPGGVVAYVTCSPHRAETRFVVDDVLKRRPDVERLDAVRVLDGIARRSLEDLGEGPDAQLWPHLHGTDAMFLSLLRRR